MAEGLNERQLAFVREYLVDLNATAAAKRAGYSESSARVIGSENLTKPDIQAALTEAMEARAKRTGITADRVLNEIAKIAFSDMRQFSRWGSSGVTPVDSSTLSDADAACVAEVSETVTENGGSIKVKLHDKVAALEKLGRHLALWERAEVSVNLNLTTELKPETKARLDLLGPQKPKE